MSDDFLVVGGRNSGGVVGVRDGWMLGDIYKIPVVNDLSVADTRDIKPNDYMDIEEYRIDLYHLVAGCYEYRFNILRLEPFDFDVFLQVIGFEFLDNKRLKSYPKKYSNCFMKV